MWVVFLKDYVFTISQLPQIWRIVTCFCITGPQLGLIMDPFFLYHYASQLESGSPRFSAPGAFAFYLFFVASVILVSAAVPQDFTPRRLFPILLLFFQLQPRISARTAYSSCHGSWKRGRLPLHCAAFVIRKS